MSERNEKVKLTGAFAGVGTSLVVKPRGRFNASISGVFVATVQVQRRFDGAGAWLVVEAFAAPAERVGIYIEPEDNVEYRLECTAFTSGSAAYRLSS